MKSQVGLGRLHPDGRLDQAQDTLKEPIAGSPSHPIPEASELVSVMVHVEKTTLDELLQRPPQS